jgi:uncharacterized RDD family membrane protein YckC
LTRGQTIGKRAFGLRVMTMQGETVLLSVTRAFFRYFFYLGCIVLMTEIPPILYRHAAYGAQPELLDAHMLIVLSYFCANFISLLLSRNHRALHDVLTGTVVLRASLVPSRAELDHFLAAPQLVYPMPAFMRRCPFHVALGVIIGSLIWSFGSTSSPELRQLSSVRYQLEHDMPIRIVSASTDPNELQIQALLLDSPASADKWAKLATEFLKTHAAVEDHHIQRVAFSFYVNPEEHAPDAGTDPIVREVDWSSLEVRTVPPSVGGAP